MRRWGWAREPRTRVARQEFDRHRLSVERLASPHGWAQCPANSRRGWSCADRRQQATQYRSVRGHGAPCVRRGTERGWRAAGTNLPLRAPRRKPTALAFQLRGARDDGGRGGGRRRPANGPPRRSRNCRAVANVLISRVTPSGAARSLHPVPSACTPLEDRLHHLGLTCPPFVHCPFLSSSPPCDLCAPLFSSPCARYYGRAPQERSPRQSWCNTPPFHGRQPHGRRLH